MNVEVLPPYRSDLSIEAFAIVFRVRSFDKFVVYKSVVKSCLFCSFT